MLKRALSGTNWGAVRIVALYLLFGGLWILFSDQLLAAFVSDRITLSNLSILKGWAFIVVTALLLYWLIQRHTADMEESRDRLRMIYDAGEFGTWHHDLKTNLLTFDDRAQIHLGLTVPTLSPEEFLPHIHPDDVSNIRRQWQVALSMQGDAKYKAEYRVLYPDGTTHWVDSRGKLYFAGMGENRHPVLRVGTTQDITTRKQADEILQRYQLLAQSTRDIVLFVQRDGRILDANSAALAAYGYTYPEILALSIYDLRAQDSHQVVDTQLDLADHDGILFEAMHQRKDGSQFPVEVSSQGTTLQGVRTMLSVIRDISERKRAEDRLRRHEQLLRLFVEHSPAAIAMFDREMRYIVVSNRFLTDYKIRDHAIIGRSHYEVFPEIGERWKAVHQRCLAGATERCEQDPFPRADGSLDWVRWEIRPWYEENEQIGGLILFSEQITEQVRTEQALRASEAKFRGMAEQIIDGLFVCDTQGRLTYLSPSSEAMYGWKTSEMLGHIFTDFVVPEQIPYVFQEFQATLATGQSVHQFELTLCRRDGSRFAGELSASLLLEQGTPIGTIGLIRDITDKHNAQQRIRESAQTMATAQRIGHFGSWEADLTPDFKLIEPSRCSDEFYRILGLEPQSVAITTDFLESITDAKDRERVLEAFEAGLKKDGEYSHEYRIYRPDGSMRYVYEQAHTLLREPNGSGYKMVGTLIDITDRKIAEDALREREARLRALFTILPVGVAIVDSHRKILEINPAQERIQRLSKEELLTGAYANRQYVDNSGALIPPSAYPSAIAMREQRVVLDTIMGILRVDKSPTIWTNVSAAPLPDGGAVVVTTDITARKHAEQVILESEQRFSRAFQSSPVSMVITRASDGVFLDINTAFAALTGMSREQVIGHSYADLALLTSENIHAFVQMLNAQGAVENLQITLRHQSGALRQVLISVEQIEVNGEPCMVATGIDLTDRILAEQASRASQERFEKIFYSSPTGINLFSLADGRSRFINDAYLAILGYTRAEFSERTMGEPNAFVLPEVRPEWLASLREHGSVRNQDTQVRHKSGEIRDMLLSIEAIELDGELMGLSFASDITDRRRAEQALRESEERYRLISTVASDYMFSSRLDERGEFTHHWIGGAFEQITGYTVSEYQARGGWKALVHPDDVAQDTAALETLRANQPVEQELRIITKSGRIIWVRSFGHPVWDDQARQLVGVYGGVQDITERKLAEEEIRYQADLLANVSDAIISTDLAYHIKSWNHAAERIYGWTAAEVLGKPVTTLIPIDYLDATREAVENQFRQIGHWEGITRQQTAQGTGRYIASSVALIHDHSRRAIGIVAVNRDITEVNQQQRELEAIALLSSALRTATQRADMLAIVLDRVVKSLDVEVAAFMRYNAALNRFEPEALYGAMNDALRGWLANENLPGTRAVLTGESYLNNDLASEMPAGVQLPGDLHAAACVPLIAQHQTLGVLWTARNQPITESELRILGAVANMAANAMYRAQLYAKTEQQLDRIETLHTIETAIASSFDLKLTLNLILEQVTTRLHIDAAAIYLYNPSWLNLEYAAGRGFRYAPEYTSLRLGEGLAGRTVLGRELISIPDLSQALKENPRLSAFNFAKEDLLSYCGVPLIMKGQVKGVLELYARSVLPQDPEWEDYIKTLAQQTAIAVDNLEMFNHLQRSNLELGLAYDATIEGWSRSLDLRDRETEGHTLRVTEMTTRLARDFNVPESEIVHLRRGALLHDIGKMSVPDTILLKPDKLTDQEWASIHKHPEYAFQILSPIAYLRPALAIPQYHHEKWDGTGYPNGFSGEQIPLAARLFAVVDVWDALTSDRPYRAAWTAEQARRYILEQRGKHFDPQVVDKFLEMLQALQEPENGSP